MTTIDERNDDVELFVGPSGSTPNLGLPYPTPDDTVDVPRDIKALADRLDLAEGGGGAGLQALPVLDVGVVNQHRAGRVLTLADFTALGLSAPAGLWNLGDLTDVSGNGRALTNKGGVTFAPGIMGSPAGAAQFTGSTAQALYRVDAGAGVDPFRLPTGSWGCWLRTAKRGVEQAAISKWGTSAQLAWWLGVSAANTVKAYLSSTGADLPALTGSSDVIDDRWHFAVLTHDGTVASLYVDGVMEATFPFGAPLFGGSSPLNIGASSADGATAAGSMFYGRVDEAFVTADVLTEDQVRCLYACRIAHPLGVVPKSVALRVRRARRGATLAPADFTTAPLRLYNFTGGGVNDQGSNGQALAAAGAFTPLAGADGTPAGAYHFGGASNLSATDAGLPAALTARSYGCWLKTTSAAGMYVVMWGTLSTGDARLVVSSSNVYSYSSADQINGPPVADNNWHHVVVVEDNAAVDGIRRKLYVDGRCGGNSLVMNPITLAGASKFRVGSANDGTAQYVGQIDGVFVVGYAMAADEVLRLYLKAAQTLAPSPKNAGDHVESLDATGLLFVGDTLDGQHSVDLGVMT